MAQHSLIIATTNRGKLGEYRALLGDLGLELEGLPDGAPQVVEDGVSYLENAERKAVAIAQWSGKVSLADDSGIEVDALHGAPGVWSARYAGPSQDGMANLAKLLRNLRGVPTERRTARFRCVIVVAHPAGGRLVVERTCEGLIADEPRGAGGFGYDPIFIEPSSGRTFAELGPEEKHRCSHRGRACSALRSQLIPFLDSTAGSSLNRRAGSVNRRWSREPAPRG